MPFTSLFLQHLRANTAGSISCADILVRVSHDFCQTLFAPCKVHTPLCRAMPSEAESSKITDGLPSATPQQSIPASADHVDINNPLSADAAAQATMCVDFSSTLRHHGIPDAVIKKMQDLNISNEDIFTFWPYDARELYDLVVAQTPGYEEAKWVAAKLAFLWEVAKKKTDKVMSAKGNSSNFDDYEDPLSPETMSTMHDKFKRSYGYTLSLHSTLCDSLLGRIKREIERKSHTFIPVARVRSADEMCGVQRPKRIRVSEDVTLDMANSVGQIERKITNNHIFCDMLEILLIGGYVLAGNITRQGESAIFAPMQHMKDYLDYVRSKAIPLGRDPPPLDLIVTAESRTRALWIAELRRGTTLGEAYTASRMHCESFWLFACGTDASLILGRVRTLAPPTTSFHRPQRQTKGKGKGKGKTKGKSKSISSSKFPPATARTSLDVASTYGGAQICRDWNEGRCKEPCPRNFAHVCNKKTADGKPCAASHRRVQGH